MTRKQGKGAGMTADGDKQATSYTAGCLFAGIGGFCRGLKQAGVKVLWANENDRHAVQTYLHNYPDNGLIDKDVLDLSVEGDDLAQVDILTAGFPCQSFSMAGERKGFDDERGQLFFQIIRIIKEFGERKPKILLLENVPFLQFGDGGLWFEQILSRLRRAGYWCARGNCQVLNTAEVTCLPHRRKRLYMVATSIADFPCNDFQFPLPVKDSSKLSLDQLIDWKNIQHDDYYLEEDNRFCTDITKKMDGGHDSNIYQLRRNYTRENKDGLCPPLTANMGEGGHNVPFIKDRRGIRRLTVEECARLQGFDGMEFPDSVPSAKRYKQIGNAVSVPVVTELVHECIRTMNRWG